MTKPSQRHISRLTYLQDNNYQSLLLQGLKGIEKESLRITNARLISQQQHPSALGAALTLPHITTDYSEARLEFITPAFSDNKETLPFLDQIHQFVYNNLGKEMLLATSMPCDINGDNSIPIADYGSSNIGYMKHVYRKGLGHRYGRSMQTIAGVHSTLDASAFGILINTIHCPIESPVKEHSQTKQNLVAYYERMLAKFYPELTDTPR